MQKICCLLLASGLIAPAIAAAQEEPAPPPEKKPEKEPETPPGSPATAAGGDKDLAARVESLEFELEKLKLQLPEEGDEGLGEDDEILEPTENKTFVPPPSILNPTITAIGNGLYRLDDAPVLTEGGDRIDDQFNLREAELDLRAAVDPFANGVIIASLESEVPGEYETSVEEGYVRIKKLPIPVLDDPPLGLKLEVGRIRTEVGRINRLHLHDLPQMTRPLVTRELFGEEGYISDGLSGRIFLPTPFDESSAVELTGQLLTGGNARVADGPARYPAAVANLRWFRRIAGAHNLDLSLIFFTGDTNGDDDRAYVYSADFLYKWKPLRHGEFKSFVLGAQAFYTRRDFAVAIDTNGDGEPDAIDQRSTAPFGYFAWAQYQATRTVYLGARWDDTQTIADDSVERRSIGAYASWYTSEFLRLRIGYEHRFSDIAAEDGLDSLFAEINFVFGAHPPEPFWVNK